MLEREKLAKHRKKCYERPAKYIGVVMDGMDQKKTELPHFPRVPKSLDEKYFIPVHVVGMLVFNGTLQSQVFLNYPNIHNDSNLTVTVLQRLISNWEGVLPPVLYLQLDNTSRENKNKYVLAYLNMLVETGVFKKIKLGFLLVGHTHDQIDQMFSKFSKKLKFKNAYTLPKMISYIKTAYNPVPEVFFIRVTTDFRKFVTDAYPPAIRNLKDVSFQRQFRIKKVDEKTLMWAKDLSTTEDWGAALSFLVSIPTAFLWVAAQSTLKSPSTNVIKPEEVLKLYEKKHSAATAFYSEEEMEWWDSFFRDQEELVSSGTNGYPTSMTFEDLQQLRVEREANAARERVAEEEREGLLPLHAEEQGGQSNYGGEPIEVEDIANPVEGGTDLLHVVENPVNKKTPTLEERVGGKVRQLTIQSFKKGQKECEEGDLRDLKANTMIALPASKNEDHRTFWIAEVLRIIGKRRGIPSRVEVKWYETDSTDAFAGKYKPEQNKALGSTKVTGFLVGEVNIAETAVFAYDFQLTKSGTLKAPTVRTIKKAVASYIPQERSSDEGSGRDTPEEESESGHEDSDPSDTEYKGNTRKLKV